MLYGACIFVGATIATIIGLLIDWHQKKDLESYYDVCKEDYFDSEDSAFSVDDGVDSVVVDTLVCDSIIDVSIPQYSRNTEELAQAAIKDLNCPITETDTVDGKVYIYFMYGGEKMRIRTNPGSINIVVEDLPWGHYDISDNPRLLWAVIKTINGINEIASYKLCYYVDDSELHVYSIREIMFIKELPQRDKYLQGVVENLIGAHKRFGLMVNEMYNTLQEN